MVEEGDLDDKLEDKATNKVVDDVKKVAMEGVESAQDCWIANIIYQEKNLL